MTGSRFALMASLIASVAMSSTASAQGTSRASIPSVVIKLTNLSPSRGVLLTPVWIGVHDGTFDTYDGGELASVPLGGDEIERIAEDGNTGPITATFDARSAGAQATVVGPFGPYAPGDTRAITLNVDPATDKYFSYVSMIIPSNDAFIANGNPLAHLLFDDRGRFVGQGFIVSGDETNDAGTEVNDELAGNVAFLAQAAPDTGVSEGAPVTTHPGFAAPGTLTYPDGVLNYPVFGNGQFNTADDRLFGVEFVYVDLGRRVRFNANLSGDQEVQSDPVDTNAFGNARFRANGGESLLIRVIFRRLSGPVTAAHLHLGQAGTNGPVVVDLADGLRRNSVLLNIDKDDLTGPLAGMEFVALLNELAAGNVYVNIHTDAYPGGELRGQVQLGVR